MDSTTSSDFTLSDITFDNKQNKITSIATFLIIFLIIMLIIFYFTNMHYSNQNKKLEKLEINSLIESKNEINHETKNETKNIYENIHPASIKQSLNNTNQKLNTSMDKLTNLLNNVPVENHQHNTEIKNLQNEIEDLKSDIIILQSRLLHNELNKPENNNSNVNIVVDKPENNNNDVVIFDPIANYDRLKLTDPLVDPRGRTSADQIPTPQVAMQLNFPTQGVIDRYHRVGLLIAIDNNDERKNKYNFNHFNKRIMNNRNNISNNSFKNSYNGVDIVNDSISNSSMSNSSMSNNSMSNSSMSNNSIFDNSNSKLTSSNIPEQKTKNKKKNNIIKNIKKNKIKNSKIEGFTTQDYYETFSNIDDNTDYNTNYDNYNNDYTENFDSFNNNYVNDYNGILELIGKKITDNWYRYFTSISIGNKIIKINIHNKNKKELYTDDIVYIPELNKKYRVKIDKLDMIDYNPYFF
jgi:hypothetical protein